jgi:hypothetical protein
MVIGENEVLGSKATFDKCGLMDIGPLDAIMAV